MAVKEARDRVRAAISNSNLEFHYHRIVVNLAPANIKKEGSGFDLPIAIGILAAKGEVNSDKILETVFLGELALDGKVRPVSGALSMAIAAKEAGKKYLVHPAENYTEVSVISGIIPVPVETLIQVKDFLNGIWDGFACNQFVRSEVACTRATNVGDDDLADVKGQEQAKRALEVAAAGGHNILIL